MAQPILERLAEDQAAVQRAAAAVSANVGAQAKARAALEQAERAIRAYHGDVGEGRRTEDENALDELIKDRNARQDRMSIPDPKSKTPPQDLRLLAEGDKLRRIQREAEQELVALLQRHADALDAALRAEVEAARQKAYSDLEAVTATVGQWRRVGQLYNAVSAQLYGPRRTAPTPVVKDVEDYFAARLKFAGDSPIPEQLMRPVAVRVPA